MAAPFDDLPRNPRMILERALKELDGDLDRNMARQKDMEGGLERTRQHASRMQAERRMLVDALNSNRVTPPPEPGTDEPYLERETARAGLAPIGVPAQPLGSPSLGPDEGSQKHTYTSSTSDVYELPETAEGTFNKYRCPHCFKDFEVYPSGARPPETPYPFEYRTTDSRHNPPAGTGWEVVDAGMCGCRWRRPVNPATR